MKNGCGGLRDYQNLLWIGKVKRGLENTQQMVDEGLLTPTERKQLDRAYDFLMRVRTELHYQQKRAGDVLTLRLQGEIADSFRYQHRTILRRMEAFMRDYYRNSSLLYTLGNTLCDRLCGGKPGRTPLAVSCPSARPIARSSTASCSRMASWEAQSNSTFADEPQRLARVFSSRATTPRRARPGIEAPAAAAALSW